MASSEAKPSQRRDQILCVYKLAYCATSPTTTPTTTKPSIVFAIVSRLFKTPSSPPWTQSFASYERELDLDLEGGHIWPLSEMIRAAPADGARKSNNSDQICAIYKARLKLAEINQIVVSHLQSCFIAALNAATFARRHSFNLEPYQTIYLWSGRSLTHLLATFIVVSKVLTGSRDVAKIERWRVDKSDDSSAPVYEHADDEDDDDGDSR